MAPKKDVKGSEGDGKIVAKWNDKKTEIFLKVCVEELDAVNRPSTHFTKDGWRNIQKKFQERTSYDYDETQLKNRWDTLKREFLSFAKIVEKETGVGWDHEKKTIRADEEWWTAKSKEDPEILKWKNGGPKFLELQEKCFKGILATGFAVLMPCQDPPLYEGVDVHAEDIEDHGNNQISEDEGDSCEVGHEVQTDAVPSSSNINLKKRKKVGKGDKKMRTTEKLQRSLDRIIDGMDEVSNTTVTSPQSYDSFSYYKCLSLLDGVPNLVKGTHLYFLAVRILANKENRIAFFHFMNNDPEMTIGWLSTFTEDDIPRAR